MRSHFLSSAVPNWMVGRMASGGNSTPSPMAAPPRTAASAPGRMLGLLKVPPMNLFDATAGDLLDLFGVVPEFAPYEAVAEDPRLF